VLASLTGDMNRRTVRLEDQGPTARTAGKVNYQWSTATNHYQGSGNGLSQIQVGLMCRKRGVLSGATSLGNACNSRGIPVKRKAFVVEIKCEIR
jgi:hypothetical protein